MGWFPTERSSHLRSPSDSNAPIQWSIFNDLAPQIARQVKDILDASYELNGYRGLSKKAAILAMRLQLLVYELEDCDEQHSPQCGVTLQGLSLALCDVQNALTCLQPSSHSEPDSSVLATGIQAACGIFTAASRVGQYVDQLDQEAGLKDEVAGLKRTMQGYQSELAPHCHDLLHICSFVANEPCSPPELSLLADRVEDALNSVLTDIPLDKQALTDELKVLPLKRDKPLVTLQAGSLPHLRPLLPNNPPGTSTNIISESSLDTLTNVPSMPSTENPVQYSQSSCSLSRQTSLSFPLAHPEAHPLGPTSAADLSARTHADANSLCLPLFHSEDPPPRPTAAASHLSTVDHAAAESHFSETLAAWRKRQSGDSTPAEHPSSPHHPHHNDPLNPLNSNHILLPTPTSIMTAATLAPVRSVLQQVDSSAAQQVCDKSPPALPCFPPPTPHEHEISGVPKPFLNPTTQRDPGGSAVPKPCVNREAQHAQEDGSSAPALLKPTAPSRPMKLVARSIFRWGEARAEKAASRATAQQHSTTAGSSSASQETTGGLKVGESSQLGTTEATSSNTVSGRATPTHAMAATGSLMPVSSVEEISVITTPDGGSCVFATAVNCTLPVDITPELQATPEADTRAAIPRPPVRDTGPRLPPCAVPSMAPSVVHSTAHSMISASTATASLAGVIPTPRSVMDDLNHFSPFSAFVNQFPIKMQPTPSAGLHPPVADISPALLACFHDLPRSLAPPMVPMPNNHLPPAIPHNLPAVTPAPDLFDALKPILRSTNIRPDSLFLPILSPRPPAIRTSLTHEPTHPPVDPPHYLNGLPCCPPACHAPPRSPGCQKLGIFSDLEAGGGPAPLPLPDQTVHLRTVCETKPVDVTLKPSGVQQIDMEKDVSNWGPCLGRGGYGRVYKATYRDRPVAVKLLRAAPGDEEDLRALEAEIMHLSQLQHPNIVQVFACSVTPPDLCIVQELMEFDLYDYIHRQCQGMVSLQNCLHIGHQIAEGLREMHPGVVHRDLKPANVLLDRRLHVKIADFGLARSKRSQYLSTQRHDVGTVKYMAPECFQNANVNEKADIYSFGVLMFECLTGREPWEGLHPLCAMFQVDRGQKLELPCDCIQCPPRLRRLVDSCWASSHKDRPTAEVLVRELGQMLEACRAGMIAELME